ncbi:metallophosphoesterase [Candidatus Vecturithrix granuli]|uniref:Metallophosphoesterase n=1 Tax=Vecturithrix granuli TaxID=1499967 RepID=A0A081BWT5_VECG1|nr:metallophosphoesterase [Candidatus Vecturithrix granuli]
MDIMKIFRKLSATILFLLLSATLVGCQNDHIFRYGATRPNLFGDSFLVVGDSRSGDNIYQEIVRSISSSLSYADCLIHVGDMIEKPGSQARWEKFLNMTTPISQGMPWYAVVGNHDVGSISSQEMYQSVMDSPSDQLYYSFNLINSHFIILDTEIPGQEGGIVGEQLTWLRQDLQSYASSAQYLFVFMHRPVFPQGHYRSHDLANAQELHQLFMQYGVDAVFAGHEHQYYLYQKDAIAYIVTGGGGAPIYDGGLGESYHHFLLIELLPSETINIHVLDVHGNIIKTEVVTTR